MPYRLKNHKEPLLTTGRISSDTGIPQSTITSWCRANKIRCWVTTGGHYRLRLSDVRTYIQTHYEYYSEDEEQ
jgi:excisionase family DNA binding protein